MSNLKAKALDRKLFLSVSYIFIIFVSILCLFPFILVISGSFTLNEAIMKFGYNLIPKKFSLEAYSFIFNNPNQLINAYKMSIIVTVIGTGLSVFFNSMTAYVLSRKDYKYRNGIAFYFFFTTIFQGGLIPWYILCVRYLRFKEHPYLALIIPPIFNFFYFIVLRSFMTSIPDSIIESAKIDGASDFLIFRKLIMPLSKAAVATIALFAALNYWNDFFNPMLFITEDQYIPLQYFLYRIINAMNAINSQMSSAGVVIQYPSESFKLAMTVVATGPILLVYPFIQKYFIKGITVGAVKG